LREKLAVVFEGIEDWTLHSGLADSLTEHVLSVVHEHYRDLPDGWSTCPEGHAIYAFDFEMERVRCDLPCLECDPDLVSIGGWSVQKVLVGMVPVLAWVEGPGFDGAAGPEDEL
jgi:hypothetical protein